MVEHSAARLDGIFHALSDATRREMLRRLSQQEHSVSELAAPFQMSLAAASKHIHVLERAGLVHRNVQGRTHRCRLAPGPLSEVQEWLRFYERFWMERLEALDALLQSDPSGPQPPAPKKGKPR